MKIILSSVALCAICMLSPLAVAQNNVGAPVQDGIQVGKMSRLRNLVPAGQVEAQAQQQYFSMKSQAQQQGALLPRNDPQVRRLHAIAQRIIPFALRWNERAPQWKWEVSVFQSKQINAFCMPGGKIAFYTGILNTLDLTDDEVALVMGHEIAHALREHGRERIAKSGAANIAGRLAGAGLSAWLGIDPRITNTVTGGAAKLAVLKFSREDETEADVVGLDIAARAGYDPRAGVTLWQKMSQANKGAPPQWLSTHPAGENRITEIRKHLPEVLPLYARAKNSSVAALAPYRSNQRGLAPVR
jgi:predicted Zn-dependent protease